LGRRERRGLWETFACATGRRKLVQTAITKTGDLHSNNNQKNKNIFYQ